MTKLVAESQSEGEAASNPWVGYEWAGPEYFDALTLPILKGRGFNVGDREGSPDVGVVTEGIAKQLWPGQNPIGKRVRMIGSAGIVDPHLPWVTVIGLVPDIHFREHRRATPMLIRPFRQGGLAQGAFVMRTGPQVPSFAAIRGRRPLRRS